jgi:tRNA A58 N-methylase Trm61
MSAQSPEDTYAMGRTEAEERRLQLQAALHEPDTRRLFEAAGIGAGMKVLDLGSGAGDTAMLAAEMVGPTGRVVGVDMNATILETARRRALEAGHANITFLRRAPDPVSSARSSRDHPSDFAAPALGRGRSIP